MLSPGARKPEAASASRSGTLRGVMRQGTASACAPPRAADRVSQASSASMTPRPIARHDIMSSVTVHTRPESVSAPGGGGPPPPPKPLDITELTKRLPTWTAVVVVHGQPPDLFFLKVLNERSVVFVVPKKLFDQMAKSAGGEPLQGWWTVMKADAKGDVPAGAHWIIEGNKIRIALHREGKLESFMTYKADATDYPKTIDLTYDRGPAKGKALKGIYELDGNTLKICYVSPATEEPEKAERPKEIGAKGTVTLVFGRVAP
jgi:uncharacterized protein (TIGR03067 family)